MLSSRLGLEAEAIEVKPDFDFWQYVVDELTQGGRIDYVVCDEAQFYSPSRSSSWRGWSTSCRSTSSASAS